jgi:hypothetical protein
METNEGTLNLLRFAMKGGTGLGLGGQPWLHSTGPDADINPNFGLQCARDSDMVLTQRSPMLAAKASPPTAVFAFP